MRHWPLRLLAAGALLAGPTGCAWINTPVGVDTPVTAAPMESTAAAPVEPREPPSSEGTSKTGAEPSSAPPTTPARPSPEVAPPPTPPEASPVLTVRMSAAEETRLRKQITDDMSRANDAISIIRQRALTQEQSEDLGVVVDFLKSAMSARDTDLRRAGTLAQKARVLAEQLKATVAR
jgi:hypothetical protein